ncbi:DBH-like monooxygenase protein 1 homolog [Halichondria panicea]|uniref:DBH-like monooxygenase protein 1 homolog n=1 Tax=Halichondria panicea TaxID=6063 RepID=UPI00312BCB5B
MNTLILCVCLLPAALAAVDLSSYPLSQELRDGYTLHWSFNVEEQSIRFAVNVSTTGWVGLGLSPTGGMPNSDIVIGWVNNEGQAFLNDRFATAQSLPTVDVSQDWILEAGEQVDGFTVLAFRRDWVTCDTAQDRDIRVDTVRVIFSWNDADPVGDDPNQVMYHGNQNRGTFSLNLLGGQQDPPPDPADLQTLSITVSNITIPAVGTTYWCTAFELPAEVQAQKHYITKGTPFITEGNVANVHHILIYECDTLNSTHVGESGVCRGEVSDTVADCRGTSLLSGWAVGGTEFYYPSGVAYPIGGGGPRFLVMETHYDNPQMRSDIVDSSGLVFSYTSTAPTFEAGILQIGYTVSPNHVIPPGASIFNTFGECNEKCTSMYFPSTGITVFSNVLHTHLAGVGVTLHHYRRLDQDSSTCSALEELAPIEDNPSYDFNYQQSTLLPNPITVLPGDSLRLECSYNTENRNSTTLGGPATMDEMCLSFISYYPRMGLASCISVPNSNDPTFLQNFLRDHVPPNVLLALLQASIQGRSALTNAWNMINWSSDAIDSFESDYLNGPLIDVCIPVLVQDSTDLQFIRHEGFEEPNCTYQAADQCTGFMPMDCCSRIGGAGEIISGSLVLVILCLAAVLSMF